MKYFSGFLFGYEFFLSIWLGCKIFFDTISGESNKTEKSLRIEIQAASV